VASALEKVAEPLNERLDLTNRIRTPVFAKPVPAHARTFWYCFGGLTFFTAMMQIMSGTFLTLYYEPTPDRAYASVFYISNYVKYGWLIRSIHSWGAQLMVVFVIIHMIRVYVTASYKHPREFNWVAGVLLFTVTMTFGLTGYLLPWDQKAYWGSTVTVSLMKQVPLMGEWMARIVVGGDKLGAPTLTRFYSAHIMVLPAVLLGLLFAHFWMVRKQGISGPL
jgi:menaquinol-cytochrome c reductase cytochrome b subunit